MIDNQMEEFRRFDVIIIGAGPIGLTCAIEAKKRGLSYLIIEKGSLVHTIYRFPTNMTFFSTSKLIEIGDVPFISHGDKPNRREALEYFRRVFETWNLNAKFYERVTKVQKKDADYFEVQTNSDQYLARKVIVATGFYDFARMMNVPGEELSKVKHFYDEPHPYIDQNVIVVGSANSACDVALELFHKGAHVTMVIRSPQINERVKYWIKPNIENRIKEGSIKAYFNSSVQSISEHEVIIETPDGPVEIENDFVLAMTGYQPDFDFLDSMGIQRNDDEEQMMQYHPETHQSYIPGIYLAGVVCGGMKTNKFFIENAKDHSTRIINDIVNAIQ